MTSRILVVVSDQPPVLRLRQMIEADGYRVTIVGDAESISRFEPQRDLDLLLIHWGGSDTSEHALAGLLRSQTQIDRTAIVIFVDPPAQGGPPHNIPVGTHQYLTGPATFSDLSTWIKAFACGRQSIGCFDAIVAGDLRLNCKDQSVSRGHRTANLSLVPFRILEFLISNPGKVYSRRQLTRAIWGQDSTVDERTIDVEVKRVRAALNRGNDRDPIRTVRGNGYAFDETFGVYAPAGSKKPARTPAARRRAG
jgi:two-component system, OmpR family, phosphate regulon response regulator PhoB